MGRFRAPAKRGRHRVRQAPGDPLVDRYRDAGTSAWRGKKQHHRRLRRFLDDVGKGEDHPMPGDFLAIENFDRLSRMERMDSIPLIREIIDAGISSRQR